MTRRYEVVYIFNSSLEEAQIDERLARYHGLLKSEQNPEPVEQVNHWGKRGLAYPINGQEVGHYVVAHFATDPTLLPEYERILRLAVVDRRGEVVYYTLSEMDFEKLS